MRHLVIILLALAIVSCTSKWQPSDSINNGHDFLCNAGICDDSLTLSSNDLRFDNDGENWPHLILDLATCQAIGLDKMIGVDTNSVVVRVWGIQDYPDKGITLLLGQATDDLRTCWLATYGKNGMIDFMCLGECGGLNKLYWDDPDEHTRLRGIDSMRLVLPDKFGKPMQLSRWISYNEERDGVETDSTLWFIHHELPVTIGKNGNFTIGKIGTVYSADTTVLNNYWRSKRQLEVFSWTPLSDTTVYDRLNTFLEGAKGTITEPKQLLGDFGMLVDGFFYRDTERFMRWCCEHPDSQLTKGMVIHYKEVGLEWLSIQLKRIKDPQLQQQAKQLWGLK